MSIKKLNICLMVALCMCFILSLPVSMATNDFNHVIKTQNATNSKLNKTYTIIDAQSSYKKGDNISTNKSISKELQKNQNRSKSSKIPLEKTKSTGHTLMYKYVEEWRLGWYTVGPEWYWVPCFPGDKPRQQYGYHNVWGWYKWCGWKWV